MIDPFCAISERFYQFSFLFHFTGFEVWTIVKLGREESIWNVAGTISTANKLERKRPRASFQANVKARRRFKASFHAQELLANPCILSGNMDSWTAGGRAINKYSLAFLQSTDVLASTCFAIFYSAGCANSCTNGCCSSYASFSTNRGSASNCDSTANSFSNGDANSRTSNADDWAPQLCPAWSNV